MSEKNRDHVAIDPDNSHYWGFVLPSDAETSAEHVEEMTAVARNVLEATEGFLRPSRLLAKFRTYDDLSYPFDPEEDIPIGTDHTYVDPEGPVSADDVDPAAIPAEFPYNLLKVISKDNEVRVELADGTRYVDRTEDCVPYRSGEAQDWDPNDDPVSVSVSHSENFDFDGVDTDHVYYVKVVVPGTIWFEDSELGDANREHLAGFLQRLDDRLDAGTVRRQSDRFDEETLAKTF